MSLDNQIAFPSLFLNDWNIKQPEQQACVAGLFIRGSISNSKLVYQPETSGAELNLYACSSGLAAAKTLTPRRNRSAAERL
jgi:hypothetical protein